MIYMLHDRREQVARVARENLNNRPPPSRPRFLISGTAGLPLVYIFGDVDRRIKWARRSPFVVRDLLSPERSILAFRQQVDYEK